MAAETCRWLNWLARKVVLYFYPKDDTSGCTTEALDFTALSGEFAKAGAVVVGVSPDPVKAHDKFIAKHDLGRHSCLGRGQDGSRGLWRLEGKEHVRAAVHGRRALDIPH